MESSWAAVGNTVGRGQLTSEFRRIPTCALQKCQLKESEV